uniref:Putative lipocalin n=1 Tax=Rhipicephalus microplus TaxID=6941 RepID=A0A6G5A3S0_RHIMP
MKACPFSLLALCVSVLFITSHPSTKIQAMTTGSPIFPPTANNTLYLVGYSYGLKNSSIDCVKSTYKGRKDDWFMRDISFKYYTARLAPQNLSIPFKFTTRGIDTVLQLEDFPTLRTFLRAKQEYLVRWYTNNSLVLSELITNITAPAPPCSLWMTTPTRNISEIPGSTNATFLYTMPECYLCWV